MTIVDRSTTTDADRALKAKHRALWASGDVHTPRPGFLSEECRRVLRRHPPALHLHRFGPDGRKLPTNRTATHGIGRTTRAIVTAGVSLGLALGGAATAKAERVWDIEVYDNCMVGIPTIISPSDYDYEHFTCCRKSGGDYDHNQGKCVAPPAEAENVPGNTNPTLTPGKPRPPIVPGGSVA